MSLSRSLGVVVQLQKMISLRLIFIENNPRYLHFYGHENIEKLSFRLIPSAGHAG